MEREKGWGSGGDMGETLCRSFSTEAASAPPLTDATPASSSTLLSRQLFREKESRREGLLQHPKEAATTAESAEGRGGDKKDAGKRGEAEDKEVEEEGRVAAEEREGGGGRTPASDEGAPTLSPSSPFAAGEGKQLSELDEATVGGETAAATTGSDAAAATDGDATGTTRGASAAAAERRDATPAASEAAAAAGAAQASGRVPGMSAEEGREEGGAGTFQREGCSEEGGARGSRRNSGGFPGAPAGVAEAAEQQQQEENIATPSFKQQFFSKFSFGIIFYSVLKALMYAFFTTGGENLLGKEVNDFMGAALPFSCIPCILLGKVVDVVGIMPVLLLLNSCITLAYGFSMIPSKGTAYLGALLYIGYVSFYSSQSYCYVSDTFSSCHFGKLVGTIHMIAGLLSLLKIPMQSMVVHVFHSNYLYPCVVMLVFCAANFLVLIWLVILKRRDPHPFWPQSARDAAAAESDRRKEIRKRQKEERTEAKLRQNARKLQEKEKKRKEWQLEQENKEEQRGPQQQEGEEQQQEEQEKRAASAVADAAGDRHEEAEQREVGAAAVA